MSAVATRLLAAVKERLESEYPGVRVRVRQAGPSSPIWSPGDSLPQFSVTLQEPESVEVLTGAPDATVAVKYPVHVAYLVSNATQAAAADDTADVRDKREAVRKLFGLLTSTDVPEINDVAVGAKTPFDAPADLGKAKIASVMTFTVETIEGRV